MRNLLAGLVLVSACGTDVMPRDQGPSDGYARLIDGTWQLAANTEKYLCVRKTVQADTYISAISPVAPLGTHHTVLMVGPADGPDGTTECTSALTKPAIYGSGVGTDALQFPDGIAVHLKPGDQLLLNLHLNNAGDSALSGTSGIDIEEIDPTLVEHEANVVLAGKTSGLYVAPGGASTQTGTCTTPAGITMFAVAPHMHLLGTHMKVTYGTQVVMDSDYTFDQQKFQMMAAPITTVAGGKYEVTCSYFNPTGTAVTFGESTNNEMCFAMTFVYPPQAATTCTQ
ncbi:MAG TPA: hypothetical protein VLB44_06085 [Kofleriaceae bacterium]|nr:hypothetical protein [Kofleriaceae bacterium]